MKLRKIINLPVFDSNLGIIVGEVIKVIVNPDYQLDYVVIDRFGNDLGMIKSQDFMLTPNALLINSGECIKKYKSGEELSLYPQKVGDQVFDNQGRELGVVSDLIVSAESKEIQAVEISSGAISDLLKGRTEIPLKNVCWTSMVSAIVNHEGSE
ncbi:MAG: PRC-barrel domain-containing protein [Syntrophomonadaceae bacterium]